ncbi:hypothetical protein [Vibrio cholerae]|uniref:hypothetical protein n=1 Tax=Vibrio cholerae TaxID=666 RepID=UPI00115AF07F|nr:hypothetical protein [Vibrio cholerae]TQP23204.1 hypothetical protein FLM00_13370 [Vibrio cholerae]TQQ10707.1 hypothetical protein FLL69_18040 [Vibrio cholerae]TQQ55580.1 hypothetical protein FLL63_19080 [Vibrio cholerae]
MFDKNYCCPLGRDPKVCTCSSCYLQNEMEKSHLALKVAETKNFTATGVRFTSSNNAKEPEIIRETQQQKIERQRRERFEQSEKDWLYVQENESRYAAHRVKVLADRKVVNKSKDNTTNVLPSIGMASTAMNNANMSKEDNATNFLPRIGIKSTVIANANQSKGGSTTNFLPSIGIKSTLMSNPNKSKADPLARVQKKPKDVIVKNFRCGDLMYGTSLGRDENYLKKLEDFHKLNVVNSLVGENNGNEWARKGTRNTRSMIINSYSDPVRGALSDEFNRLKIKGGDFRLSRLSEAISKAKIGRPTKYGFDFDAYENVASTHEKLKISSKHVDEWLWWKRGSKSGIEMVAQQSPESSRKIHFILDEMNIRGVANKDNHFFGNSITASELRYIYRHWDRLQGRVIFYRDGKVVASPWEDPAYSHLWSSYHPRNRSLK